MYAMPSESMIEAHDLNPRIIRPTRFQQRPDLGADSRHWQQVRQGLNDVQELRDHRTHPAAPSPAHMMRAQPAFARQRPRAPAKSSLLAGAAGLHAALPSFGIAENPAFSTPAMLSAAQTQPPRAQLAMVPEAGPVAAPPTTPAAAETVSKMVLSQVVSNHLNGMVYDIAHYGELPAEGFPRKVAYICGRDERPWTLAGIVALLVIVVCLIVGLAQLGRGSGATGRLTGGGGHRGALPLIEFADLTY
jgi:hypothetical protein